MNASHHAAFSSVTHTKLIMITVIRNIITNFISFEIVNNSAGKYPRKEKTKKRSV